MVLSGFRGLTVRTVLLLILSNIFFALRAQAASSILAAPGGGC